MTMGLKLLWNDKGCSNSKLIFTFLISTLLFLGITLNGALVLADSNKSLLTPENAQNNDNRHNTKIETTSGTVMGFLDEDDTWGWKGIPFTKPPMGELRWKAPQDPEPWKGVRQVVEFSDACPQYSDTTIVGNEDCLYLNVWRPRTQETGLPVYFWIHGGGNSIGTASIPRYSGVKIASKSNMVVVSINYRLGPLGWFTHPDLETGDDLDDSGNYGTLDIIKALEWVRDNISAFGGDPGNVTIAGVSAGGTDVLTMVISPLAAGLFHKGISESGGTSSSSVASGVSHANWVIQQLLEVDELTEVPEGDTAAYLRSKTADQILGLYDPGAGGMISSPAIFREGVVIPTGGFTAAVLQGNHNRTPLILGTNKEEHKLFMAANYDTYSSDSAYQNYADWLTSIWWKPAGVDTPANLLSLDLNQPPVYAYEFLYGANNPEGYNAWLYPYNVMFGASHGLEVSFMWGIFSFYDYSDLIYRDDNRLGYEALSDAMMAYVAEFARTGHPGTGTVGGFLWEPWLNPEGGTQRILLDANDTETIIEMSTE